MLLAPEYPVGIEVRAPDLHIGRERLQPAQHPTVGTTELEDMPEFFYRVAAVCDEVEHDLRVPLAIGEVLVDGVSVLLRGDPLVSGRNVASGLDTGIRAHGGCQIGILIGSVREEDRKRRALRSFEECHETSVRNCIPRP